MSYNKQKANTSLLDQKATIQMIVFITISIALILTFISFIHIYSSKKDNILKKMCNDSVQLQSLIADNFNYSNNFIDILTKYIKRDPKNLSKISNLLTDYVSSSKFNFIFGWRKFSWINSNFEEVITSTKGLVENPKKINFISNSIDCIDCSTNKIISHKKKKNSQNNSLKIVNSIFKDSSYQGSIVLSYDISTLVRNLNIKKKHKSTNFVILDKNLEIVAQSNLFIHNLLSQESEFVKQLQSDLQEIQKHLANNKDYSYLDMLNGLNYYITEIEGFPFILIINVDMDVIKDDILKDMVKNFIIVFIFSTLFLLGIIFIYKRETRLREKSEKASLIATHAAKAKTNFLAFTAHEIRSPLGFILTGSEIMSKELMGKMPKNYKKYVEGINQNSQEILKFITDILDENQIIEGKFKITNNLHRIDSIVDDSIENNLTLFNTRIINIKKEIEDNLPLLLCDKHRVYQIFNNLISNSIKYSENNTTIEIKIFMRNSELNIIIRDQGHGIEEEKIPLALSPYYTGNESDKFYSYSSYGLGLSIVKMLLEAHEADLRISSVKGKGTTVKIIFPKHKLVYDSSKNN